LKPNDTFWQSTDSRYLIVQEPEALLEISLNLSPSAAAGIGWAVGNLHLELMAEATRLLTPDDKAARQLLDRIQIPFTETVAVFRPGRFVRGAQPGAVPAQELGLSHKHA
jgi:urease accessory protein